MCGITGIITYGGGKVDLGGLAKFNDALSHRGPDGCGLYISDDGRVGLGHRRLAILDLSENGKQPMSYLDGRYQITFNGEIYNFIELRKELLDCGYKFQSDSDTEVIMAAYDKWREKCLDKFNGMWAFAIWDNQKNNLFLARDRFGVKPLYYFFSSGVLFAFSSETVSFKYLDGFKKEIDEVNLTMALQNSFSLEGFGKTIYKNVKQILPGHYVNLDRDGNFCQKRWWNTRDHLVRAPLTYEEQVVKFKEIFFDACRIRMRSDVPLATALSGGLDSSSVYCAMQNLMRSNVDKVRIPKDWRKAFVAVFPGTSVDEAVYAKKVIDYTNGSATYIQPDYLNLVQELVNSTVMFDGIYLSPVLAGGEIYGGMRKEGIKISMDGHGVDEMLFGYSDMVASAHYDALLRGDKDYANDTLKIYLEMQLPENNSTARQTISKNSDRLHLLARKLFRTAPMAKKLYNFFLKKNKFPWLYSPQPLAGGRGVGPAEAAFGIFHETTLPTILRNFDRASMQHGVEIRMPFMDWRLVAFIFSLPLKSRLGDGFTKRILRDNMKGIMPEEIRIRKLKIGLNAPMKEWFKNELKTYIYDEVSSKNFLSSNVWDGKKIKTFVEDKIEKKSWTSEDCAVLWPYLNAHILMKNL